MPVKNFLLLFFSHKLDGQPAFKFDKNIDVRCFYCMVSRAPGFLGCVHFFGACHSKRSPFFAFSKRIVSLMDPFDNQMHVS
jgi:hypothetical protein